MNISFKILEGEPDASITLPGDIGCKDLERIGREIRAALDQAELRGEQKALAKIAAPGGEMKVSDELMYGEALLTEYWQEFNQTVAEKMFMEIDKAIMGPEVSVKARFLELLEQHPELARGQVYIQAVMEIGDRVIAEVVEGMETDEPIITKAWIGNLDEYRYCIMQIAVGDEE